MLSPATYEEAAQGSDPGSIDDHSRRHHSFLLQRLQSTLSVRHMNDATFLVEGGEVVASRLVLAAASEYFRALLVGEGEEFKERVAGTPIKIHDIDKPTFEVCVQYLYGGAPELTRANVAQVVKAADMFQIEPLCSACAEAMATMIDESTCFHFLVLAQDYPKLLGDVRAGCLDYVEQSLDNLFCHDAEAQDAINALSLGTMLHVCDRVGLGLAGAAGAADPAQRLQSILDAVVAWGRAHFGPGVEARQDLYGKTKELGIEGLAEQPAAPEKFAHAFHLAEERLVEDTPLESDEWTMGGYGFRVVLYTNNDGNRHCGAYLYCPTRTAYPDWWQCHAATILRSDVRANEYHAVNTFAAGDCRGFGYPKFLPHAAIPDVPDAVGTLARGDVRARVELTAELVLDSITSLLTAHSFFHHDSWPGLHIDHLEHILRSDALPVSSEDALLGRLLSLGRDADELGTLLEHVRWQFLTPAFLLDACRNPECSAFRSCARTKAALHWYFGRCEMPEGACRSRRASYDGSVQDQHGAGSEGALVDFLVGRVGSPCWPPAPGGEAPQEAAAAGGCAELSPTTP